MKYSIQDVDRMRVLVRALISHEKNLAHLAISPGNIEDRLRTYLSARITRQELEGYAANTIGHSLEEARRIRCCHVDSGLSADQLTEN